MDLRLNAWESGAGFELQLRMPRKIVLPDPDSYFHIFSRSNNRTWFQFDMDSMWSLFQDQLYLPSLAFNVKIYSFVLMNNHFHMMARFPDNNMSEFMEYFMREMSREMGRRADLENHKFKARYGKCKLSTPRYASHCYKYIYRNPIRAGLCQSAEEYKYSTLNGRLGLSKMWIPLVSDLKLEGSELEDTLCWLNQDYKEGYLETLKVALHRAEFKLPKMATTRQKHPLESEDS